MMNDDIIRMAKEARIYHAFDSEGHWDGLTDQKLFNPHPHPNDVVYGDKRTVEILERFAALAQAAERNKLALWMIAQGYATGHGDTIEGLLKELEWQVRESEREACAKVCDQMEQEAEGTECCKWPTPADCAHTIRARGNT
jgi:hypothetical protein